MPEKFAQKITLLFSAIGPGLFLIGYNIGTGSVTTMASAGSRYGMTLFWALLLSCVFTFVMLVAFGRYTAVTGETSMAAFRKRLPLGNILAIYSIIALVFGELASLAGIAGIVTDLVNEWTRLVFGGQGANRVVVAVVIVAGCFLLLWNGNYSRFEKFLVALVIIMGAGFLSSMILVIPDPVEVSRGLVPGIPDEPDAFLIVAGIVGTTCGAMVFVMRSIVVAEKGWGPEDVGREKVDALVSSGVMLLLSAAIMACAAGTLFRTNQPVEQAVDMVKTLEPLAGKFAISLLTLGIIGAGISTLFPIVLIAPWLICDYRGTSRDIRSPIFRILGGLGLLVCLIVPVFGGSSVWIMVASQAFQATLLPLVTIPMIVLLNRKDLMGANKAGLWLNLGLWATLVFALVTSCAAVRGLADTLNDLF